MSDLALVSIILGAIIILTRCPTIFAPKASRKFFLRFIFSSNTRIRITGIFAVAFGVLMINVAQDHNQAAALVIKYFGWILVVGAGSITLIFTSLFNNIFVRIVESMREQTLRIIGAIGTGLGVLFIYFGLVMFWSWLSKLYINLASKPVWLILKYILNCEIRYYHIFIKKWQNCIRIRKVTYEQN